MNIERRNERNTEKESVQKHRVKIVDIDNCVNLSENDYAHIRKK